MKSKGSISKIMTAVALLALSIPVPAFSAMMNMPIGERGEGYEQMMGMGNMDGMMGMCLTHADKMGLTADQIAKMKPLHREMQKSQVRFKADLRIAEIDLMDIMDVKDFDLEEANVTVKKIADIKTAHQLGVLKNMKEMRSILTDDQFNMMKKMMPMKKGAKRPVKRMMMKK